MALYRLGRLDEAEQIMQSLISRKATWRKPHLTLAAIYHQRGEPRRARDAYERAAEEGVTNVSGQNAIENHHWQAEVANLLGLPRESFPRSGESIVLNGTQLLVTATASEGRCLLRSTGPPEPTLALRWCPSHTGARLLCRVVTPHAGRYQVSAQFRKFGAHGSVRISVGEQVLGKPFDGYSAQSMASGEIIFGEAELVAGDNEITLQITGSNALSSGFRVWIEQLRLTPMREQ
jgi:hypothetical protein